MRILILEDDDELAIAWQLGLEQEGHFVQRVAAAADAIELVGTGHFDMVITDVLIRESRERFSPEGGLSLLGHIDLHIEPKPVTIAVTGAAIGTSLLTIAQQLRCDLALRKPVSIPQLVSTVEELWMNSDERS